MHLKWAQNCPYGATSDTFNVKLVTSLPQKMRRVLSHDSQLCRWKKTFVVLSRHYKANINFTVMQEHFRGCTGMEAWNDVMKVTRLETYFIFVNKKFKMVGVRLILLV